MSQARPVYLAAGDALFSGGAGADDLARTCIGADPRPARMVLAAVTGTVSLPYFGIDDPRGPQERLDAVITRAMQGAGLVATAPPRTGVLVGTSSGDIAMHEQRYTDEHARGEPRLAIHRPFQGNHAESIARDHAPGAPRWTFTTACSASANALLYAAWMIREGRIDHALVLGLEQKNQITPLGFHSLMLLTQERCRPFDARRDGIILGETVAAIVLSCERPAAPGWQLLGGATLCDASHPTNPSAERIAQTMRLAADDAQRPLSEVTLIKAHGTGTPSNDLAEGRGVGLAFGARVPPLTSLKPVLGHCLGACGVLETLALTACVDRGLLPPTAGFELHDPATEVAPLRQAQPVSRDLMLLNFFGFGGNNCSLLLAPC